MSRSVVPDILAVLEPWLGERIADWQEAGGRGEPTLPATPDGKVNVRGIVEALRLPRSQEQHFFRHAPLRTAVNAVAAEQGLKPIGARNDGDDLDKAAADRIRLVEARSGELTKMAAEQAATIERLRQENRSLRERLGLLEETGQLLRTGSVR